MPITLDGSTGVTAAAFAGSGSTLTSLPAAQLTGALPALDGSALTGIVTRGTAVASTSGTIIDFTGIPSSAKRVTVMFSGVSQNGTGDFLVQLGTSSGITTSGYTGRAGNRGNDTTSTNGIRATFWAGGSPAAWAWSGAMVFVNVSSNIWVATGQANPNGSDAGNFASGSVSLASALTRLRFTTTNTGTFDAGTINIMYEG